MKKYDGESEPENFVHAYMQQMKQTGNPGLEFVFAYSLKLNIITISVLQTCVQQFSIFG